MYSSRIYFTFRKCLNDEMKKLKERNFTHFIRYFKLLCYLERLKTFLHSTFLHYINNICNHIFYNYFCKRGAFKESVYNNFVVIKKNKKKRRQSWETSTEPLTSIQLMHCLLFFAIFTSVVWYFCKLRKWSNFQPIFISAYLIGTSFRPIRG